MNDDNLRNAHRHGRAWRDLDGNVVEGLTQQDWRSIARLAGSILVLLLAGVAALAWWA